MTPPFRDRKDAGRLLFHALGPRSAHAQLVLALPRGGVPVAHEIAAGAGLPLDVLLVRKVGVPGHEELAMGAIASGGVTVWNEAVLDLCHVPLRAREQVVERERQELQRREDAYREGRPPPVVRGKRVIVVDDGLATGSTMRAAVLALRRSSPAFILVAVPIAAPEVCADLHGVADDVVCALTPRGLSSVGEWYEDFAQTSDDEVRALLRTA